MGQLSWPLKALSSLGRQPVTMQITEDIRDFIHYSLICLVCWILLASIYFLFSISAFHILKDTTIQFTLEKVPVVEDTQFSQSSEELYHSTGLLKVEGKFVNAVQVRNKKKMQYARFAICYSSHFCGILHDVSFCESLKFFLGIPL